MLFAIESDTFLLLIAVVVQDGRMHNSATKFLNPFDL